MEGWTVRTLGELYEIGSSKRVHKRDWSDHGVPFYRAREIVKLARQGHVENDLYITEELFREYEAKTSSPAEGDLMVTAVGTLGVCYVVNSSDRFYFKDASVLWFRPKGEINSRFMEYAFLSPQVKNQTTDSQGATVGTLTISRAKALQITLPPLAEQERIVAILDEAFAAIATATANAEKNLANARELFESELNRVFSQKGEGWVEKILGDVCKFASGGTPSKEKSKYWSGAIPWVSGRDMKSTQVSDTTLHISQKAVDESSTRMVHSGSLLILVRGMGLAHGAQIVEVMVSCAFNQDIKSITPQDGVLSRYLLFALRTRINMSPAVLSNAAHGTLKIDMQDLKNVEIPIPPVENQLRVVAKIDSLSASVRHLETIYQQKLDALAELKQSILQKAFSGELTAARSAE